LQPASAVAFILELDAEAVEVTKVTLAVVAIVQTMASMVTGMDSGQTVLVMLLTEAGGPKAVGIPTREAHPCLGWPRQVLKPGDTPGVAVITSIGVGPMVQPRVMGVATEANVTVEKAMDQHGKQNTEKIILE
jgi:hypothetical protein